ncbi:MAG: hypothetical protein WC390_10875 [Sulfurimonas sp.]
MENYFEMNRKINVLWDEMQDLRSRISEHDFDGVYEKNDLKARISEIKSEIEDLKEERDSLKADFEDYDGSF